MTYLTRPVFLFAANWAAAISRSVTFSLRPEDIGYGATFFTPTQLHTVNQWQFDVTIPDAATLLAFDAFTAALLGPLNGFWLPIPFEAGAVTAGTSTSVFSVAAGALSTFWNDRPDQHLLFTFVDGTQAAAKIQSVVAAGATETVTLTTALAQVPAAGTCIQRLHYVRLANDTEEGEFLAEAGMMQRHCSVVELPLEYAAAQQGLRPIYLFRFWANAPIGTEWRFTSFAAGVVSNGKVYTAFAIDFSGLEDTADGTASDLKITSRPAAPLNYFMPQPFSGILYVEVSVVDYATPNVPTVLFNGRVVSVEDGGSRLNATCENRLGFLRRKIPRFLKGQTCNNTLFDPATCRAGRAYFETTVNVVTVNAVWPPTVVCTFAIAAFADKYKAANYLAGGLFEAGLGLNYEARSILGSSWNAGAGQLTLTLNQPLGKTVPGNQAQIVAGCDHTAAVCAAKFNNYVNFSGFPAIPPRNPTLKAVNANSTAQGGK
jgi:uncharacterized phage protein (TIGR02218 family)